MEDFATLAGLLRVSDLRGAALSKRDAEYLGNMISKVIEADVEIGNSARGISMLKQALRQREQADWKLP